MAQNIFYHNIPYPTFPKEDAENCKRELAKACGVSNILWGIEILKLVGLLGLGFVFIIYVPWFFGGYTKYPDYITIPYLLGACVLMGAHLVGFETIYYWVIPSHTARVYTYYLELAVYSGCIQIAYAHEMKKYRDEVYRQFAAHCEAKGFTITPMYNSDVAFRYSGVDENGVECTYTFYIKK